VWDVEACVIPCFRFTRSLSTHAAACGPPGARDQLPVDHWHEVIVDPTIADAVLDRIVHTAHRLILDGETLRKPAEKSGKRSKLDTDNAAGA
jgi:hypothetical protein